MTGKRGKNDQKNRPIKVESRHRFPLRCRRRTNLPKYRLQFANLQVSGQNLVEILRLRRHVLGLKQFEARQYRKSHKKLVITLLKPFSISLIWMHGQVLGCAKDRQLTRKLWQVSCVLRRFSGIVNLPLMVINFQARNYK